MSSDMQGTCSKNCLIICVDYPNRDVKSKDKQREIFDFFNSIVAGSQREILYIWNIFPDTEREISGL